MQTSSLSAIKPPGYILVWGRWLGTLRGQAGACKGRSRTLNQLGRRNLSAYDRTELALKLKPIVAAKAKENQLSTLKQNANTVPQKSVKRIDTQKEIAKAAGVSHDTIAKVEKIQAKATPEVKAAV